MQSGIQQKRALQVIVLLLLRTVSFPTKGDDTDEAMAVRTGKKEKKKQKTFLLRP
jgi:hypothetical protein